MFTKIDAKISTALGQEVTDVTFGYFNHKDQQLGTLNVYVKEEGFIVELDCNVFILGRFTDAVTGSVIIDANTPKMKLSMYEKIEKDYVHVDVEIASAFLDDVALLFSKLESNFGDMPNKSIKSFKLVNPN